MKLSKLSDKELLIETKNSAEREKQALISLLYHLREVELRRLYSALRHPSMFEYVVKDLEYSEPEAIRRVSAMRLMRDVPEIEEQVNSGTLSLTNMVLAQTMFSKERKAGRKYTKKQKIEVLEQLESRSTREAHAIVKQICPEMGKKREEGFDGVEDEALREKLLRLKGMLAHIDPDISLNQLLHKIADEAIVSRSPSAPKVKRDNLRKQQKGRNESSKESQAVDLSNVKPSKDPSRVVKANQVPRFTGGYVARALRYSIFFRDQHKCTNCGSVHALQIDHIIPRARGGKSTQENLRLLCRACNQRAAIEEFGLDKMKDYISDKRPRH